MLEQLNPEQRSAVVRRGRPLLVLAGAGSGKTKTLTERMASLLAEGVNPAAIAAITFTNKAAREMRQRLAGRVGSELAAAVSVCTFHALGLKLLLTRLRGQLDVIVDPEVRQLKAGEFYRYFVKNRHQLSHELDQIKAA